MHILVVCGFSTLLFRDLALWCYLYLHPCQSTINSSMCTALRSPTWQQELLISSIPAKPRGDIAKTLSTRSTQARGPRVDKSGRPLTAGNPESRGEGLVRGWWGAGCGIVSYSSPYQHSHTDSSFHRAKSNINCCHVPKMFGGLGGARLSLQPTIRYIISHWYLPHLPRLQNWFAVSWCS